ncbi:hypothetical protein [Lentilactobacillus hilgardii]|uniref:Collagen-like protein n=1 Tax=Lentilactobacillus hilgardii (strain ATCC 8290 / DSM 20176 / CCUG 30140 / JCM 1155 / KCTC 3500 / NBRC 15886 / NCIMB 8040 / NRRL B-1843 / 9) TaxID=1423757 RepID=C0XFP1_LENH9|nr:hypothetical protein [Lentilactobacillus hilgardii]EEI25793.1 hypothetical protein HMPREF0519_0052 [Lentilactobacillus hilgardii DSM 20176 = ATCC 8290]KRK53551.1 hypothetical protein FD42_GL002060 [Lentilactobacillus hilgardii DSM 20176 = ATCC 8290]TDG78724.1 hypothetical protein C5L34_000309 [Lentilactobacillus hilgardii]
MSKELAFTDDNDVVKYLDTTTAFNLALTADGVAFDLTNAKSILVKIANDDGYIMQETIDLTTVTSPLGGTLSFPINQDIMNTLVPDDYDIEVWVTMNDGTQAIFPSDGTLGFSIEDNLMSDTGEVIPTISLNDFQQQFDDLSSQMENAVQNVHKGDQGNPGNGIKSANNQYQLSDSPVTVPTGGWSDTILATTDQLPYLWTKIIFTYDDGTTNEINFVSSRGDTGSQGPIGPVGPQGKQGNGLVVRGKADKEENLPTTGNNQGDGYLVGTDLYIWIDDSWQNMGSITPDLADYVKVADMNNALNTKVNVTDMRKPASDVAGIEEVNAKQDKIAYTPADDSKVVHSTDTSNWQKQKITNDDGSVLVNVASGDLSNAISNLTIGFYTLYCSTDVINSPSIKPLRGFIHITWYGSAGHNVGGGTLVDEDGIAYTVTALQGVVAYKSLADDSKVAHLSGANNFDTVPTVNNNPLLLASSLPSDLARTGQDTNFMGKLQKSGIDVATTTDVTNAVNTATSNVVTTDKLANFTAGLQSGGVSVATSDDLKSVEASAWRQLDNQYVTISADGDSFGKAGDNSNVLYKIDEEKKFIYFSFVIFNPDVNGRIEIAYINFSSIVKNISFPNYNSFNLRTITSGINSADVSIANNKIKIYCRGNSPYVSSMSAECAKTPSSGWEYSQCFICYDALV